MLKRMLLMIAALAVVFGGIFGWKWFVGTQMAKAMKSQPPPVVSVSSIVASNETWHPTLSAVATLRAVQGTDVSPQMAGQVSNIDFKSGQLVHQGDLLVQLDISVEQAQLEGMEAQRELARTQLRRIQELSKTHVVAKTDLDQAEATFKQAKASVQSQKALIARKTIRAPFTGLAGIRQVSLGDYLAAGTRIVTLQSLNPIYADFALPQEDFSRVKVGQPVTLTVNAYPEKQFTGRITAIDSRIAEGTRNFAVRASLTNEDLRLRPGMFGEAVIELPELLQVITVPKTAVTYNPYGDSVFIVHPGGTNAQGQAVLRVKRVFVQTGAERGTQTAITKGVQPGQQVVTSGQMKLQEGTEVRIDNKFPPVNVPAAAPPDEH